MINNDKIQEWFRMFMNHVQEETLELHVKKQEGYKFAAVDNFQKYFDIEATSLSGMLDKAIVNNNLVTGAQYWPRNMLLLYAEEYPEETRHALRNLYDETRDVYARIDETAEAFEKLNERRCKKLGTTGNSYIGLRFISLLLGFRYPEKYNALKPTEWKVFCRFVDPEFMIPKRTSPGEQYRRYEPYIDMLRSFLENRGDVRSIRDALTRGLVFTDAGNRWITQDAIYVTARLFARDVSMTEEPHAIEEDIEAVEYNENESDGEVDDNTGYIPLEKHLEEYVMKNWDLVDFGEKLTIYREDDGTPGQQYVTDVGIIDILAKDTKGNFVVIELKRALSRYHVVGQVLNYMTWVQENLATGKETVRGMIVVGKADATLMSALKQVSDKVTLKEYRVKMTFVDPA